jgi:hypothetical protein
MTSDLSALTPMGFIKPFCSSSDFRNWLLPATDFYGEHNWLALTYSWEHRPFAATKSESATASSTSSYTIDSKMVESQQTWDIQATKVRGLLGRMLDASHRDMYYTERDPATVWKMLK